MREDVVQFFTERYLELTDSEKLIADYILANLDDVIYMNVHTLAKNAKVSVATIVRFAQHMGFDGYSTFKLYLAKCRGGHEDFILDFQKDSGTSAAQVQKVLNAEIDSIRLTMEGIDFGTMEAIADRIRSAKNLLFFGKGTSHIIGSDACLKFLRIGKTAFSACDLHTAALYMAAFSKDDLVIGISHSGQNREVCGVLQAAGRSGLPTVAITTFPGSKICQYADHILYTKTRESPFHKIAITSRISQFAIMDALFMAYIALDHDNSMAHIDYLSEYLDMLNLL